MGCEEWSVREIDFVPMVERVELRPYQPPDSASYRLDVRDVEGVEHIRSAGVGTLGRELVPLTEIRRIGIVDGEPEYALDDITDVTIDRLGRVLSASGEGARVKVFDSTGVFLRQIGGKGEGPGEFLSADHLWTTGDTVVVADHAQQRTSAFSIEDGALITLWSRWASDDWVRPVASATDRWIAEVGSPPVVHPLSHVPLILPPSIVLHGFDPGPGEEGQVGIQRGTSSPGRRILELDMPEQHVNPRGGRRLPLFVVTPGYGFDGTGRVFVTSPTEYRIDVHDGGGVVRRTIRREHVPVPVTENTIGELRDLVEALFARDSVLHYSHRAVQEWIDTLAELPLPARLPPLGRILVSLDGSFWVERADAPPAGIKAFDTELHRRPLPIPTRWDLFGPTGDFRGTAETPPGFMGMAVREFEITGLVRDEYLVEHVVTYRVEQGVRR